MEGEPAINYSNVASDDSSFYTPIIKKFNLFISTDRSTPWY